MEVKYRSANGMFEVNFDVKNQTDLFAELASFQEVFENPAKFAINGKEVSCDDVRFRVRTVEKDGKKGEYYELVYQGPNKDLWGYRKAFGCSQENKGGLFPKWAVKEDDKDKYENGGGGWFKWKGGKAEHAPVTSGTDANPGF